jgi:hypothetical protein
MRAADERATGRRPAAAGATLFVPFEIGLAASPRGARHSPLSGRQAAAALFCRVARRRAAFTPAAPRQWRARQEIGKASGPAGGRRSPLRTRGDLD